MLAVETNVFPYVRRRFSFRQYSLFDFADSGYVKKLLAVLPDMAFLLMDGNVIEPSSPYLMDRDGNLYVYIEELDAAIPSENTFACSERGEPITFPFAKAKWISVISMETALEQLGTA